MMQAFFVGIFVEVSKNAHEHVLKNYQFYCERSAFVGCML